MVRLRVTPTHKHAGALLEMLRQQWYACHCRVAVNWLILSARLSGIGAGP